MQDDAADFYTPGHELQVIGIMKKQIAIIDHSFHAVTNSSDFFKNLVNTSFDVDYFWDTHWTDQKQLDLSGLLKKRYDCIIVWQVEYIIPRLLKAKYRNIVFVPMYDGCMDFPDEFWLVCAKVKVISFSRTLHERLIRLGLRSLYVQYFPDPHRFEQARNFRELRGFFWQRRQFPGWQNVKQMIGSNEFSGFYLHLAVDPGCGEACPPSEDDQVRFRMRYSSWFERQEDYWAALRQANIYFAPRPEEGIGMAFLEAMAMGMVVVAPNRPTMNEYIIHGVNGLLYNPRLITELDFLDAERIGTRARQSVILGHEKWLRDQERIIDYLVSDDKLTSHRDQVVKEPFRFSDGELQKAAFAGITQKSDASDSGNFAATAGGKRNLTTEVGSLCVPDVTIAIVVRNDAAALESTLLNVLDQNHASVEIVVVDGASTDATLSVIEKFDSRIDYWTSQPDQGPYDGMNTAASLARGHWIVFMNAGDFFAEPDAISRALRFAPREADFLIGHHLYRLQDGMDELHHAADFDQTWHQLVNGPINGDWLSGVPGHQATFTRTALLQEHKYDLRFRIAADHEFMYRMRYLGARFYHTNEVIAIYTAGGLSAMQLNRCIDEWWALAKLYSTDNSADSFFSHMKSAAARGPDPSSIKNSMRKQMKRAFYHFKLYYPAAFYFIKSVTRKMRLYHFLRRLK